MSVFSWIKSLTQGSPDLTSTSQPAQEPACIAPDTEVDQQVASAAQDSGGNSFIADLVGDVLGEQAGQTVDGILDSVSEGVEDVLEWVGLVEPDAQAEACVEAPTAQEPSGVDGVDGVDVEQGSQGEVTQGQVDSLVEEIAAVAPVLDAVEGWARDTGYGYADTAVRQAIVAQALAAGAEAPQSVMRYGSGTWLTDISGTDGDLLIQAFELVHSRASDGGLDADPDGVRAQVVGVLSNSSGWQPADVGQMADQVLATYPGRVPALGDDLLAVLEIRAQCMEFAQRTAIAGGGTAFSYGAVPGRAVSWSDVRPGMGLFNTSQYHAMIIVNVDWNASGVARELEVVDSNWGQGWTDSAATGEVPWRRSIRTHKIKPTGLVAAAFD